MVKVIRKSLLLLVVYVLLAPSVGFSQYNAHSQYKDLIGSDFHFSYLSSAAPLKILSHPEYGNFSIKPTPESENLYRYTYSPGISKGNTKAVVEYYRINESTGELIPDYTTLYFRITPSLISCTDDFVSVEMNSATVIIDVVENDTRTNGPLILEEIIYSENGIADILEGKIEFKPKTNFSGDAFVYYSVTDDLGETGTGLVKIKIVDPLVVPKKAQLNYISHGGEPVEIDLPYDGFKLSGGLMFGTFKSTFGKQQYIPSSNASSSETFQLSKGGISRTVTVEVIYKNDANSFVVDDLVYTSKGSSLSIDVFENDLKATGQIIAHSTSLEATDAAGVFVYEPPSYFSGTKNMSYTVNDGYRNETGAVVVHVNDFIPVRKHNYEFLTEGNSTLVIDYNIPLNNFSFEIVNAPNHGEAFVNNGYSTITFECDEISGNNLILYSPEYNYSGHDEFTVRYCVDGSCRNVNVAVDVVAPNEEDCRCYTGCVWSGDANDDGVVNAADILTLAYAFGETGPESILNAEQPWNGRKVNEWFFESKKGVNAKYADSDGNGVVDEADFDAILENYNRNHALVPPQFLSKRNYPFTLEVESDTVYVGDLINFDIGLGNSLFPALDIYGVSFSLGFPASFVDSASMDVSYFSDSWLGIDERVKDITHQVRRGWIESGAARLSTTSASGAGVIAKASFIVEEDVVGGFRVKEDGIIPMVIEARDIRVVTEEGEIAELEDVELTIYIDINERAVTVEDSELQLFPNPANDYLNIHMNGGHDLVSYEIFNANGIRVSSSGMDVESRSEQADVSSLSQGVYIMKAQTTNGQRIQRFEVIR